MTGFFSKPLSALDPTDIQELITEAHPEGATLEFKSRLSTKGDKPDAWQEGGKLGGRARDEITIAKQTLNAAEKRAKTIQHGKSGLSCRYHCGISTRSLPV